MVGAFLNSLSEDRLGVIEKQSGDTVIVKTERLLGNIMKILILKVTRVEPREYIARPFLNKTII